MLQLAGVCERQAMLVGCGQNIYRYESVNFRNICQVTVDEFACIQCDSVMAYHHNWFYLGVCKVVSIWGYLHPLPSQNFIPFWDRMWLWDRVEKCKPIQFKGKYESQYKRCSRNTGKHCNIHNFIVCSRGLLWYHIPSQSRKQFTHLFFSLKCQSLSYTPLFLKHCGIGHLQN